MPAPYKTNDQEWNEVWVFIDTLDIIEYIRRYQKENGNIDDLRKFMEYIAEHCHYTDVSCENIFRNITPGDFEDYLYINYRNDLTFEYVTRMRIKYED